MTMRTWAAVVAVAGLGLAAAALADQQQKQDQSQEAMPEGMADWMAMSSPNEHHEKLHAFEGAWHAQMRYRMDQGASAEPGEFESEFKVVMDGRFVEEHVTSETPMGEFRGRGLMGYDNTKRRYVATWFDNTSTTIHMSEGYYDAGSKAFEFHGESPGMDGEWAEVRSVLEWTGKNTFTLEEWVYEDDGTRWQRFGAEYRRE